MKHNIILALRNLKKYKLTTSLNLVGLVCAFTAFIIIMLYVRNENQFDRFNTNFENIYRLELKYADDPKTSVYMLGPTAKTLMNDIPEIINTTTIMPWGKWGESVFKWDSPKGQIVSMEDYSYCDENATSVFTFNLLKGERNSPLKEPNSAMVSASFAQKAWGNENPIGKRIKMDTTNYVVTSVFQDLPQNSVIQCPIILKLPEHGWIGESAKGWNVTNYPQFLLVKPGTDPNVLNDKINNQSLVREKYSFANGDNGKAQLVARPLSELRFCNEAAETPMFSTNSKMFVKSLFWIGILILLVSTINYINFATANTPRRTRSISISRIIGSQRYSTISLYMVETVFLFLGSLLIALLFAYFLNSFVVSKFLGYSLPYFTDKLLLIAFVCGSIIMGVIAGIYPALYSTSGKPIDNIKRFKVQNRINLRGLFTVTQFAATIALIIVSLFVVKQVRFMEKSDVGFTKEDIMVIKLNNELRANLSAFENKLSTNPFVKNYAFSRAVPGRAQEITNFVINGKNCPVWYWASDSKYVDMMGFTILQGRNFFKDSKADIGNIIINETAAKRYEWKVGQVIGGHQIVGIIKDFNMISLRDAVEPFAFWFADVKDNLSLSTLSIKMKGANMASAVSSIGNIYNDYCKEMPFRYFFLDDQLNMLYNKENQQVKLISSFSILSVIISILGILGLSIFITQTRIKEIGIRKVNGAKEVEVLVMLNINFIQWVIIAFILTCPVAWFLINNWLQNFAYKTELSWWVFGLAGLIAFLVAIITVSWQSYRAATRNPVEALRYE